MRAFFVSGGHVISHRLITAPIAEPLTVSEVREHCRLDSTTEDVLLEGLIAAARQHVEAVTGRALVTQTWELRLPDFQTVITLPKAPAQSVSSITYVDASGATQTLASTVYQVLLDGGPSAQSARVVEAYGQVWPGSRGHAEDVRVRYVAGYGLPSAVPAPLRHAMLLLVGHLYENREASAPAALAQLPFGVSALLAPHTVYG